MRISRISIGLLVVVCLLGAAPDGSAQARNDRDRPSPIERVIRQILNHLLPTTNGDSLSPPKP